MGNLVHAEIRIALTEGLLSEQEAPALERDAAGTQRSPLALLLERGRLSEETYASLCAYARSVDLATFPVPDWDRYEPIRLLGEGGMGRVFLARDLRLARDVALKFVRGDDPEFSRRIVREARAQARVSHPRVCKVYEVGEIRGKVYIAMQYIDGRTLADLARQMSIEQLAMVLRDAALGVQAAHSEGLIHRDIKPTNILVELGTEGRLDPYVVDFGLARSVTDSTTMTGSVLGTPHYMSPEQARGEVRELDRRTDVYGLGATLYTLLTGEPPVPGDNALEVLNRVATFEPRPPRAIDPNVPADLEAIALKCLEKDRSARYGSARALADDLDRFLAGEPVLAHPGIGYRLRKRLKKHARTVAILGAALVIALTALGLAVREQARAAERERLTQRFTEIAEQVESRARYAALSRLHDIHPDRQAMRAAMGALEAETEQAAPVALGPGHYALGRGFLAIGDEASARRYLESAWQLGYREPRVAYGLALLMARLYQRALIAAERVPGGEARAAKKREIGRLYRDPALFYLRQSEGAGLGGAEAVRSAGAPSDYLAALIAFCEERFDDALERAVRAGGSPWFYEAPKLRGEILLARALSRWNKGEHALARADLEAGRRAFAEAAAAAESAPAVHQGIGELEYAELVFELYGGGGAAGPFERGMAAVNRALTVDSHHYESLVLRARLQRSMAEYRSTRGSDAAALIASAVDDAERAVAAEPGRGEARLELAQAHRQSGDDRQSRGDDPSAELQKAISVSESIAAEERDYDYHVNVGLIYQSWADYQDQAGVSSNENRREAIEAYGRAIALNDGIANAWLNLGVNYFVRASQPGSSDAERDLERAASALEKGRSINSRHIVPYFYGGEIHVALARRKRNRGVDPAPELTLALASYRDGLTVDPKLPHLYNGIGAVLVEQATAAWDHGSSPDPLLEEARASFEKAIAVAPDQGYGYHNVGDALARRAYYQRTRGEDPTSTALTAASAAQEAIERIPGNATLWVNLGTIYAIVAGYELEHGRDPARTIEKAKAALDRALAQNSNDPDARVYMGEVLGLAARFRARNGGGKPDDFAAAARVFQEGIALAPEKQEYPVLFGRFCHAWASWLKQSGRDPEPALSPGIASVNRVLASRSAWADALAVRAGLLLARTESATTLEVRRDVGRRAAEDFARALSTNRNLEAEWMRYHQRTEPLVAAAP
ncbi:protein kinase domain-containing protein [Sorangium sp. So ce861]|uniref:serine/threonine-protein kinase n=1 Tax=Sorangium sp. So ce861 TaxID=3133323 RepID=UPI003F630E0B